MNNAITNRPEDRSGVDFLAESLFQEHIGKIHRRTDRLFAGLMGIQWVAGIITAVFYSPFTWSGSEFEPHIHVYAAVFLGGLIAALPIFMAIRMPGRTCTRQVIAIGQALTSALLIHLAGGRIEVHFHVFGSLALLAFYRDWKVLVTATIVTVIDHFARGTFWPQSVFGVMTPSAWRWLEHGAWVAFEDVFLIQSALQGMQEMREIASNRATLELTNAEIERQIIDRTNALASREAELHAILQASADAIFTVNEEGLVLSQNKAALRMFGDFPRPAHLTQFIESPTDYPQPPAEILRSQHCQVDRQNDCVSAEILGRNEFTGESFPIEVNVTSVANASDRNVYMWSIRDITERRRVKETQRDLHRQQVEIARVAGMSEIATGVLHNVGNALNSVNVSAHAIRNTIKSSKIQRVTDVGKLLSAQSSIGEFMSHDDRGRRIPAYLSSLGGELSHEHDSNESELDQLISHVEHIKAIVATQQSIAKPIGLMEEVQLSELVDESLGIHVGPKNHSTIAVVKEYEVLPLIRVDRARIMQILFNLVSNAKESVRDSGIQSPRIQAIVRQVNAENVCVTITDNGQGIEQEKLERIFAHGFTTKSYGHGFGLHASANAATEMGGGLTATSQGPGKGASFNLVIPLAGKDQPAPALVTTSAE